MENNEILDEFQKADSNNAGNLQVPRDTYRYLDMAAKWGNILAIIGFVFVGLGGLLGLALGANLLIMESELNSFGEMSALIWASLIVYFAILVIYILPLLYLMRFASNMKTALYSENQGSLVTSFENLGRLFKFLGILTLVVIGVYVLLYAVIIAVSISAANSLDGF